MSERFQNLFKLPGKIYCKSSPIIIMAGALLKDTEKNQLLVHLKFKNISNNPVSSIRVNVICYSTNGSQTEIISGFSYLDLSVLRDMEFGSNTPIYLNTNETRMFHVEISEVVFLNGDVKTFNSGYDKWEIIDNPIPISSILNSKQLVHQYRIESGVTPVNVPVDLPLIRYCSCGSINEKNEQICHLCGNDFDTLIKKLDVDLLNKQIGERKKRNSKILKFVSLAALAFVLAIFTVVLLLIKIVIPNQKYNKAISLMNNGEFYEASTIFSEISNYKDCSDRLLECEKEIKNKNDYDHAVQMMDNGYLDIAIISFESLGEYKDSREKKEECRKIINDNKYNSAIELMNDNEFEAAISLFESLGAYKDCEEKIFECEQKIKEQKYYSAIEKMKSNNYEDAISIFESLDGFLDSEEKVVECKNQIIENKYLFAVYAMRNNEFINAISIFESLGDYKNSKEKINECNECLDLLKKFNFDIDGQGYSVSAASSEINGDIVIPSMFNGIIVTSISEYGFKGCKKITSIVIPKTITNIKSYSFHMCEKIKNVVYEGTVDEWSGVYKGFSWNIGTAFTSIICSDGVANK